MDYSRKTENLPAIETQFEWLIKHRLNLLLYVVFSITFSLIFLEMVLCHALLFVASHLEATMAIPIALLGISIGGLIGFFLKKGQAFSLHVLNNLLLYLVLSFAVVFVSIVFFSSRAFEVPYLLLIPFILGSIVLSIFFVYAPSSKVYFADLVGAGCGAVAAAFSLEYLSMESSFFLGSLLVSVSGFVFNLIVVKKKYVYVQLFAVLAVVSLSLVVYHGETDNLNLARLARIQKDGSSENRIFYHLKKGKNKKVTFTRSSLAGRIDALATLKNDRKEVVRNVMLYHDGLPSDSMKFRTPEGYALDPRVPWGFMKNPDTLIIGTSAEGIVNAVKGMGNGKIYGVELCPGKVEYMLNDKGKSYSHNAYQHIDHFELIDARSFLNNNPDLKFDHITLMNAHLGARLKRSSAPEYLHTVDAFSDYLNHLTDRGLINIEETSNRNKPDDDANAKLTATIIESLKRLGVKDPGNHMYVFRWARYIQYLVKKQPFSNEELAWLDNWVDAQVKNKKPRPFVVLTSLVWHPQKKIVGPIARMIESNGSYTEKGRDYSPATDDRPFVFDVYAGHPLVSQAVKQILLIAGLAVFLPALILLFGILKVRPLTGTIWFLYFGLTGIAYLFIEIVFIQKFEMYLGSPVLSVITIIGGMLIFSGIGSLFSERFCNSKKRIYLCFLLIGLCGLGVLFGSEYVFVHLAFLPVSVKAIITVVLIAPLAFFMGMPFPVGLTISKNRIGTRAGALMFSINGGFAAIAAPLACLLAMNYGFFVTLLLGTAIYFCLLLFVHRLEYQF